MLHLQADKGAMKRDLILGPPGCGKTYELMEVMERELASGVRPDRIMFTTFTKKGANEAIMRACTKFGFKRSQLPYFRTMHSLAFQELQIGRDDVMQLRDYKRIGEALGLDFGYVDLEDGKPAPSANVGDQMLYILSLARSKRVDPFEEFQRCDFSFTWWEFERFIKTLDDYKNQRGLTDFSDMIEQFCKIGVPLNIDVAIIDEAQDLSLTQWTMAEKAIEKAQRLYVAGDDDQAIFKWSGADVDAFLNLKGKRKVLGHSYRLPKAVFDFAEKITARISHRFEKKWEPRDDEGSVEYVNDVDDLDVREGTNLFLARNKYLLAKFETFLRKEGYPYTNTRGSSIEDEHVTAIRVWERLRRGDAVEPELVRIALQFLPVGTGIKRGNKSLKSAKAPLTMGELESKWGVLTTEIWHEALTGLPDIPYYLAVLRRGEKLDQPPRIHVSTIHAVKGGEADHVQLMTDISWKTYQSYIENPDDEHRVFYVAVTRARKTLQVLLPTSNISYDTP
jgi:superfamily I DNA/RNA helicase